MKLDDFDYELPPERIALTPPADRESARLLVYSRATGAISHHKVGNLPEFLRAGDALVLNNTRVLHARLYAQDDQNRTYEVFLLKETAPLTWQCLVKPGKRIGEARELHFAAGVRAQIAKEPETYVARFEAIGVGSFMEWLAREGNPPLPPYIKRAPNEGDKERYQTVFAKELGSVAAPTAGLHFTPHLLERLRAKGVCPLEVTLHVGYGTFGSIRAEQVEDHRMHLESYALSAETLAQLRAAKARGERVICVGTTALRTLESIAKFGLSGDTDLFIYPGYHFQWPDGLLTNFHLPKSSLYILVAAFIGLENTRRCYAEALEQGYRFFSYGDAMLII